jgi:hypothetical protein
MTFHWDYHGPRAEGTARHFCHHLDEFLTREGLTGCRTAVVEVREGHWAVACDAEGEAAAIVERVLRPRRRTP